MHKKALECAKKVLEEFCLIPDPTCEQASLFESMMCGYAKFIESEYKATIIDEMKEAKEEEKIMSKVDGRMGYRNRDSMGRFTGGGRRGYRPYLGYDEDDYMGDYLDNPAMFKENMKFGYHGSYGENSGGSQTGVNGGGRMGYDHGKYGKPYEEYRGYRRNYTETHDPEQKKMMSTKMSEIFNDMEDMANDMVHDMTPDEKEKYRQKLNNIVQKLQ